MSASSDDARRRLAGDLADELYEALSGRFTVPPLRQRGLNLDVEDAYAISLALLAHRLKAGETVIGKKIGVTSAAVQNMLGVHQPDFGFLTDRMQVPDGSEVSIAERLIQPRAEAEIALILKSGLEGPGISPAAVLAATESIAPCFEIVDSRIQGWDIGIVDTIADNGSSGLFVLGDRRQELGRLDLAECVMTLRRVASGGIGGIGRIGRIGRADGTDGSDQAGGPGEAGGPGGEVVSTGTGASILGDPLAALAWLATAVRDHGRPLRAGEVVLSGSLGPMVPVAPGDAFHADISGVGHVGAVFAGGTA